MFGFKETDDLDEIFNLDNLDAPPIYDNRRISNNQNSSINADSAFATESQISNLIENYQPNRFRNAEIFQANSTFNMRENLDISTDSVLGGASTEISTLSESSTQFTQLSFFSLMKRSLMSDFVERQGGSNRPTIMTQGNSVFLPTQDEQPPTQISSNSTSTRLHSPYNFSRPGNTSQLASNITAVAAAFFGSGSSSTVYHGFEDQNDGPRLHIDSQGFFSDVSTQNSSTNFGSYNQPSNITNIASSVPTSILNLYQHLKTDGYSDWTFIHLLSAQLCQEFMPMNCNVTLKKSLLLSIASINTKTGQIPIPIIAIGGDTSSVNSTMLSIGNYAQRFLAPTDHLFNVSINSDKLVEVGPIFIAKNGVCYLGDWSGLKKSFSEEVKIIIDSGRYFFNQTSENFQLGSAIWTYWSSSQKIKNDFVNIATFFKYFGIPIVLDSDEETTISFLLNEAKNGSIYKPPSDTLNICYGDIKDFLDIIRKVEVTKSVDAQTLLTFYSETINKDREGVLSVKGFQVIQQMAESFAKLSMRNEVEVCDVEAAVAIAEDTFNKTLNRRITAFPQAPVLGCTFDIQEIDQYMQNFHTWIHYYIAIGNNQAE